MTFVETGEALPFNANYLNFAGLVNEVLNYGFNDGPQVNRGRIKAWLNEAQYQIARQVEGPEYQATEAFKIVQGTYKYPLPPDFLRMQDIWYPSFGTRLRPVDLQQFDMNAPQIFEGTPSIYALYGKEVWLYPCPGNSQDELQLRYIAQPPQLVEDSDVPRLNPNYWHLLIRYALIRAFESEDDYEAAQTFRTTYERDLDDYATDVQERMVDRPKVVEGSWSHQGGSSYGWGW